MKTIYFIHGMFQTPKSWDKWVNYFTGIGYKCETPAWPYHEGQPSTLRTYIPFGLGELRLKTLVDKFSSLIAAEEEPPIIIGHSVGGLLAQILVNKGLGASSICIDSVAPNKMLVFDCDLFKNTMAIANPLAGNDPFLMTPAGFHENFCNTMSEADSNKAYVAYAVHDSRNVFRDCLGETAELDLEKPHVPLLFIAGEKDNIIPSELNKKNAEAYADKRSITDFKEFPGRGHFICNQPGWEEVAAYVEGWLHEIGQEAHQLQEHH